MEQAVIQKLGDELYEAAVSRRLIPPFHEKYPQATLADAYRIQSRVVERYREAGNHVSGKKMGYTDPAMRERMKLPAPSYGFMFREKQFKNQAKIYSSDFVQPGLEAEILFVLGKDLKGKLFREEEIRGAVEYICPAYEIVDRRQRLQGRTQQDSIGDNGSFGGYVVGNSRHLLTGDTRLEQLKVTVWKNGTKAAEGIGQKVMGNPLHSLLWAANILADTEDYLRAGEMLLSGSLIPLLPVKKGDSFRADFGWLGQVAVSFL